MNVSLPVISWFYIAGLVAASALTGCCWGADGSGVIVTETHSISDHAQVDVCCGWNVHVEQSDEPMVLVTGDDNIVREIVVDQDGSTLRVHYQDPGENFRPTQPVEVTIRMAAPEFVRASGGASVSIEQLLGGEGGVEFSGGTTGCVRDVSLDLFEVTASGGSRLCAGVDSAGQVLVDASGGSIVNLRGDAERLQANVSGGARLSAFELDTELATVAASGGSRAQLAARRSVTGAASGGSVVVVDGPEEMRVSASGGSRVERR